MKVYYSDQVTEDYKSGILIVAATSKEEAKEVISKFFVEFDLDSIKESEHLTTDVETPQILHSYIHFE